MTEDYVASSAEERTCFRIELPRFYILTQKLSSLLKEFAERPGESESTVSQKASGP